MGERALQNPYYSFHRRFQALVMQEGLLSWTEKHGKSCNGKQNMGQIKQFPHCNASMFHGECTQFFPSNARNIHHEMDLLRNPRSQSWITLCLQKYNAYIISESNIYTNILHTHEQHSVHTYTFTQHTIFLFFHLFRVIISNNMHIYIFMDYGIIRDNNLGCCKKKCNTNEHIIILYNT